VSKDNTEIIRDYLGALEKVRIAVDASPRTEAVCLALRTAGQETDAVFLIKLLKKQSKKCRMQRNIPNLRKNRAARKFEQLVR